MINRLQGVFESFHSHEVKYLVIGGVAAILHGVPRATLDLDILIEATPVNATRLLKAMEDGGLATATMISAEELLAMEITIFRDRVRIDVQNGDSWPGFCLLLGTPAGNDFPWCSDHGCWQGRPDCFQARRSKAERS